MRKYEDILTVLTPQLRLQVGVYVQDNKLPAEHLTRTDVALALLRINSVASLKAAEQLMGIRITKCPPCIPPWPPLPVKTRATKKVLRVNYTKTPRAPADRRFRLIKPNMTVEQLLKRGVTHRDIRRWSRTGRIVMT